MFLKYILYFPCIAFAGQISIGFGGSSNPTQSYPSKGGSFSSISPAWSKTVHQTEKTKWDFSVGGEFRKFSDEFVASNADSSLVKIDLANKFNLIQNLDTGIRFGAQKFMGRIAAPDPSSTLGDNNEYMELSAGAFIGSSYGPWTWLIDLGLAKQNFNIASYDSNENMFFDDRKDFRQKFVGAYTTNQKVRIEFQALFNDRIYGDGAQKPISELANPGDIVKRSSHFLQEDFILLVVPSFEGFGSESSVGIGQDVDRANGTVSQKRQRVVQKFEFTIGESRAKLIPSIDVSLKSFPFLPISPVNFAEEASPPRQDIIVLISAGVVVPVFSKVDGNIKLSRLESSSNFPGQTYSEDLVETSLSASF